MGTDRLADRRHRSEYNSPSTIPFFITIVLIKEGRAKKRRISENEGIERTRKGKKGEGGKEYKTF
jgi:hypothetical protein